MDDNCIVGSKILCRWTIEPAWQYYFRGFNSQCCQGQGAGTPWLTLGYRCPKQHTLMALSLLLGDTTCTLEYFYFDICYKSQKSRSSYPWAWHAVVHINIIHIYTIYIPYTYWFGAYVYYMVGALRRTTRSDYATKELKWLLAIISRAKPLLISRPSPHTISTGAGLMELQWEVHDSGICSRCQSPAARQRIVSVINSIVTKVKDMNAQVGSLPRRNLRHWLQWCTGSVGSAIATIHAAFDPVWQCNARYKSESCTAQRHLSVSL